MKHPVSAGWKEPTEAQAKAGNYRKERLSWCGLEIAVEQPAGSVRRGVDPNGEPWETRMLFPYGYVVGSEGADRDPVDVYLGPNMDLAPSVFVVRCMKHGDWDEVDEDKVFIGFDSAEDARAVFLQHYDDDRFLGDVVELPVDEFVAAMKVGSGLIQGRYRLPSLAPEPDADVITKAFTDRLQAAVVAGEIDAVLAEEVTTALALAGPQVAVEVLRLRSMAKAEPVLSGDGEPVDQPDSGLDPEPQDDPAALAEDMQDLADALLAAPESPETEALLLRVADAVRRRQAEVVVP